MYCGKGSIWRKCFCDVHSDLFFYIKVYVLNFLHSFFSFGKRSCYDWNVKNSFTTVKNSQKIRNYCWEIGTWH